MRGWIKKGINLYLDFKSFKTSHPVVVIESDDWGSLRTKDKSVRHQLNALSPTIKEDPYTQLDSIATQEDLEALFDVLHSVKDRNGNPACMTANVCTANPDFEAIKNDNFERFHYVPFTKTLEDYSENISLFELWGQGRKSGVFKPQLHGREHVHALAWLAELKAGNKDLLKAFELETWGIHYRSRLNQRRNNLQAALDYYDLDNENRFHKQWVLDSIDIFKKAFEVLPKSFIPPAYVWHSDLLKILKQTSIQSIQGIKLQYEPIIQPDNAINKMKKIEDQNYKKRGLEILSLYYNRKPHYIGQKDKSGLIYTTRNAFFEPYSSNYDLTHTNQDWVKSTMLEVEKAIQQNKPVIIGSHRINYIGRLNEKHRNQNLKILQSILKQIVRKYPEVEFMDSGQLADRLSNNMSHKNHL